MKKFLYIILIVIIIGISIWGYLYFKKNTQQKLSENEFDAEEWAKSISGFEEIPTLNEIVVVEGQTGDGAEKNVLVYHEPEGKQASFVWKKCREETEQCQTITKATFIYLSDTEDKFINSSTEGKKIRVEGILKVETWPNNSGFGPIVEVTKVEIIK